MKSRVIFFVLVKSAVKIISTGQLTNASR
ncbi:hypothetical protein VCAG7404_003059A, partial [Vibrio cholerae O1 str. AG-7404]